MKSAEETKGKVDAELKDLHKALENIETARPIEDLTCVCLDAIFGFLRVRGSMLMMDVIVRTRLLLRHQRLTGVPTR